MEAARDQGSATRAKANIKYHRTVVVGYLKTAELDEKPGVRLTQRQLWRNCEATREF